MRSDCQLNVYGDSNQVNSPVMNIEFSPSGRLFFASYEDGTLVAWDVLKGTWMGDLIKSSGPSCMITSIQASANGSRIYTSSWDGVVSGNYYFDKVTWFREYFFKTNKIFYFFRFGDTEHFNDSYVYVHFNFLSHILIFFFF